MNSYKTKLRSVKKRTTNFPASILKKKRSPVASSTANKGPDALSRRQLIVALSEMGIVVPRSMSIDVLRSLYDVNAKNSPSSLPVSTGPAGDAKIPRSAVHVSDALDDDTDDEHVATQHHSLPTTTVDDLISAPRLPLQPSQSSSVKIDEQSKNFSLFSNPIREEVTSVHPDGVVERGHDEIVPVPKGLRKAILEGYNVNLFRLLLPRATQKSTRDEDDADDRSIYLKPKVDVRLDRQLTILEFILAFSKYMTVICDVFAHRRRELTAYLNEIIRLSVRFGHHFFYDYHCLFAEKAETMLHTRNVLVDWSKRDQDIYIGVFGGLRPVVCEFCRSPHHFSHFCRKVLDRSDLSDALSNHRPSRTTDSSYQSAVSSVRSPSTDHPQSNVRQTCKYFNGAGFGKCVQANCRFLHVCARCRGNHSKKSCPQTSLF